MTFDSGAAWDDAVRMIKANKDVLAIVAGVFFFLPTLAQTVLSSSEQVAIEPENIDQMLQLVSSGFANNWYIIVPAYIIMYIGSMAIHALLGKAQPPTVGEAIGLGARMLPSYLAFNIIIFLGLALVLAPMLLFRLGTGLGLAGVLIALVGLFAFIVVSVRLSLVAAIFGIEETTNPIATMQRSWSLVKGNTASVFLFVLLISIAAGIVALVLAWGIGLLAAATGPTFAMWIDGAFNSLISSALSVLMVAVYTAIYLQMKGVPGLETFE